MQFTWRALKIFCEKERAVEMEDIGVKLKDTIDVEKAVLLVVMKLSRDEGEHYNIKALFRYVKDICSYISYLLLLFLYRYYMKRLIWTSSWIVRAFSIDFEHYHEEVISGTIWIGITSRFQFPCILRCSWACVHGYLVYKCNKSLMIPLR